MQPFWISAFLDLAEQDHERTQEFWAAVTGYDVSPHRGARGEFTTLAPAEGDAHLRVQRLDDGASRIHLDLHVADPSVAAERAETLGAQVVARPDEGYVVLASPAGIPFCLVSHPASRRTPPARWGDHTSLVDQVCLDVPPPAFETEVRFWAQLTGFEESPARSPRFRRLRGPLAQPVRLLVQRVDDDRPARAHLDLASTDRAAEVARHRALGAIPEHETQGWTVLHDPAGLRYCVTRRDPTTGDPP